MFRVKSSLKLYRMSPALLRLCLVSCAFFTVLVSGEVAIAMRAGGVEDAREQGIHYFRQGMMGQAQNTLEEAYRTEAGKKDFRTILYLARIYYDQADIGKAVSMAEDAVEVSNDDVERQEAVGFLDGIRDLYGSVIVVGKDTDGQVQAGGLEGFLHIEDVEGLIAVEKKDAFEKIRTRQLGQKVKLPTILFLPSGSYKINGKEVKLSATEAPDKVVVELWGPVPGEVITSQLAAGVGAEAAADGEPGWFAKNWKTAALGGGALVAAVAAVGLGVASKDYSDKANQEYQERYIVASNPDEVSRSREIWESYRSNANTTGSAAWVAGGVSVALIGAAVAWNILDKPEEVVENEPVTAVSFFNGLAAIPSVSASEVMLNLQCRW